MCVGGKREGQLNRFASSHCKVFPLGEPKQPVELRAPRRANYFLSKFISKTPVKVFFRPFAPTRVEEARKESVESLTRSINCASPGCLRAFGAADSELISGKSAGLPLRGLVSRVVICRSSENIYDPAGPAMQLFVYS